MTFPGLRTDGTIAREGSLDRISPVFAPVVGAARLEVAANFGAGRLHSIYLYGSIPRGTAVPGRSDLDLMIALRDQPDDADRGRTRAIERRLDQQFPQIDGAGVQLCGTAAALSELERHDLGFFVACLCTPLAGPDLAEHLPRYRPTSLLARETNGDLDLVLPQWRQQASGDGDVRALTRRLGRRLVRTGFTLVMPRWGGWTSDLDEAAEAFAGYYAARARQMSFAADVARRPSADPAVLLSLIDDLGAWLADEYVTVHGRKAPRP
jgi:predicted nucleotidyltransferase